MKKGFIFLSTIVILYSFIEKDNEEKIIWKRSQILTWKDFMSKPDNNSKLAAISTCRIIVNNKVKDDSESIEFTVESFFVPDESWVKIIEKNDHLLKHEQGHFDLNEVYARKIRQEISATKFKLGTLPVVLREIYTKHFKELNTIQDLYDLETAHSQLKNKQTEWDFKIDTLLKKLEQYSYSTIVVPY